jgi:hypothetical protein
MKQGSAYKEYNVVDAFGNPSLMSMTLYLILLVAELNFCLVLCVFPCCCWKFSYETRTSCRKVTSLPKRRTQHRRRGRGKETILLFLFTKI